MIIWSLMQCDAVLKRQRVSFAVHGPHDVPLEEEVRLRGSGRVMGKEFTQVDVTLVVSDRQVGYGQFSPGKHYHLDITLVDE